MSVNVINHTTHRFADVAGEPCITLAPLEGFNHQRLVNLEEATVPLQTIVPRISVYVHVAKERVENPENNLSADESAAIALYTMEWTPYTDSLYYILNATLRTEDRQRMKPWFPYLKLLFTALSRLPSIHVTVYRGVRSAIEGEVEKYQPGKKTVWWGFSSCSTNQNISEKDQFLGQTGRRTLFVIECLKGKDIGKHSYYKKEKEILLLPATRVEVTKYEHLGDGLSVIYLKEIESPHILLESVSTEEEIEALRTRSTANDALPRSSASDISVSERRHNKRLDEEIARFRPRSDVYLIGKRFTDDDMELVVQQLIITKQCRELFLRESKVTPRQAEIIFQALPNNKTLEKLFLSDNRIGDIGVKAIAKALSDGRNSTLKQLCLGQNGITDDGAEYLATMLGSNQTLTHLYLPKNKITDRGLQRLATVLTHNNRTLQLLALEWNEFHEDASVKALVYMLNNNRPLNKLNLEDCNLPKAGVTELKVLAREKRNFELTIK